MGWARTLLLGDIGNRLDIADAEKDIESIRQELRSARVLNASQEKVLQDLQRESEQLEVCMAALIRTLAGKGTLASAEVERLVKLIDD